MFLCGVETSRGESWKDKKEQDGVVIFGSGVAKAVLRERFETIWLTMEKVFLRITSGLFGNR